MPLLSELLQEAVGELEPRLDLRDIEERAARHRTRHRAQRVLTALALVLALAVAGGVVLLLDDEGADRRVTADGGIAGAFPDATGVVLVFDDGYDGVALVDLDHRVAIRRPVEGQRAGDQPYRLTREDDALIVGWSEVYAVPLDGGASRLLGHATISIPGAEPGRVWLIDYPGGRIGNGVPTLRQVDLTGKVMVENQGLDPFVYYPAIGIPGGIAYETSAGIALWDATTGGITARLGSQQAFAADTHNNLLAWCEAGCPSFHISRLDGGDLQVPAPGGTGAFDARSARFSPDGRLLAAVAGGRVVLIDTNTGTSRTITSVTSTNLEQPWFLSWAPDGDQLFFSSYSYGETETHVGQYDPQTGKLSTAKLPFGGALDVVAVDAGSVEALLTANFGPADSCPPPTIQPSGRSGGCGFNF